MTDRKSIKRALISSVLAIVLCCAMLVGTTFAWFTDMISTGINTIRSGNLDAVLEYDLWDTNAGAWANAWATVDTTTRVFTEDTKWEPGVTEVVRFRVSNVGSLAFKYELGIQVNGETTSLTEDGEVIKLSDYLLVGATGEEIADRADAAAYADANIWDSANLLAADGEQTLLAGDAAEVWSLVIHMPKTVGNEANHATGEVAPQIDFGVVMVATQFANEADDFGNDYDLNAQYLQEVTNADELVEVLEGNSGKAAHIPAGTQIDLTLGAADVIEHAVAGRPAIVNDGELTITGGTIVNGDIAEQGAAAILNRGELVLNNVNVGSDTNRGVAVQNNGGNVEINGGTFATLDRASATGGYAYVFLNNGGTMVINDATVNGRPNGVFACNAGTLTVNGGDYTINSGANTYYMVYATDDGVVNLNGGTFTWNQGTYSRVAVYIAGSAVVNVGSGATVNW